MGWLDNWRGESKSEYEALRERLDKGGRELFQITEADFLPDPSSHRPPGSLQPLGSPFPAIVLPDPCSYGNDERVSRRLLMYAKILRDEIHLRCHLRLEIAAACEVIEQGSGGKQIRLEIVREEGNPLTTAAACEVMGGSSTSGSREPLPSPYDLLDERCSIHVVTSTQVLIRGYSARAVLFGIGRFLRNCLIGSEQFYGQVGLYEFPGPPQGKGGGGVSKGEFPGWSWGRRGVEEGMGLEVGGGRG